MFEWMQEHEAMIWWLSALSMMMFFATLILVPVLIARLPSDYFTYRYRHRDYTRDRHPVLHHGGVIIKNLLGIALVLIGLALLVLPGQGILTLLIGLMLIDFPGKYALEKRLVRQGTVMRTLNRIRAKVKRPPFEPPEHGD
jgi:hypothetical protein